MPVLSTSKEYEPRIIAYLCTWCSYTGADTAGIGRMKYPANLKAVRVPCSGRVSPEIIMRTFDQGADGVLVLGCHIGECHYETGNHRTAKRFPILHSLMTFAGLEEERLRLDWVSASEGERFSRIVNEFIEAVKPLGPANWRAKLSDWGMTNRRTVSSDSQRVRNLLSRIGQHKSPSSSHLKPVITSQEANAEKTVKIQAIAKQLLAGGEVATVIGYEIGPRGRTRPAFIKHSDEVERLVWNQECTHNLTTYLPAKLKRAKQNNQENEGPFDRVALVVKPCDSLTINVLTAENQIARDKVHVIGISCDGILEGAGFENFNNGQNFPLDFQVRCQNCQITKPVVYDTLIGEVSEKRELLKGESHISLQEVLDLTTEERMDFWLSQFDRCIRCYACRQVCPQCNCPTCLYERDDSLWVGMGTGLLEKRAFHLGRAYHLAGRCIGCNECERVCPVGIPISLLNQVLSQEMEKIFSHRSGYSVEPSPIISMLSGEERMP
jgi:coenzyme F420-reducing hydrogenase delta subunit/ferredoxin